MRDDELVAAARSGDPEAFAALAGRHRARAEAVVERLVGDEAEDLVQEALLRTFLGLSQLREPPRFGAWLCGIAVNLAKMRLRRRALEARAGGELRPAEPGEDRALLELVREAVEILPAGQRDVVLMHYVEDLSCDEIAAILGTSPGAVRVRLHRARAQLREELAPLVPVVRAKEELAMIEMRLEDVVVRVSEGDPTELVADLRIVLLAERDGDRRLPIWVGAPEGNMLALHLRQESPPRPLTSDLFVEILRACGARVERVVVTALRDKTFHAIIALEVEGRVEEIDARPSDALNVAVRVAAPIFVAEDVLAHSGLTPGDLEARLDTETCMAGAELPSGEWRSLSREVLRALYAAP